METWRWKFSLAAATAVAAAVALMVSAHSEDVAAIAAPRQAAMAALSASVKIVDDFAAGRADQATAIGAATRLRAMAEAVKLRFASAADGATGPGRSLAKSEIETERTGPATAAVMLIIVAGALLDAVRRGDRAAALEQLAVAGQEGGDSCHNAFGVRI